MRGPGAPGNGTGLGRRCGHAVRHGARLRQTAPAAAVRRDGRDRVLSQVLTLAKKPRTQDARTGAVKSRVVLVESSRGKFLPAPPVLLQPRGARASGRAKLEPEFYRNQSKISILNRASTAPNRADATTD